MRDEAPVRVFDQSHQVPAAPVDRLGQTRLGPHPPHPGALRLHALLPLGAGVELGADVHVDAIARARGVGGDVPVAIMLGFAAGCMVVAG